MPKNVRIKKNRSFKVYDLEGQPYIRFGGKYLSEELGLSCGDRLEILPLDDGTFILRKQTAPEASWTETSKLRTTFKTLFNICEQYLEKQLLYGALNRYDLVQLINELKACGEVATTLHALSLDGTSKTKVADLIHEYKEKITLCEQTFYEQAKPQIINVNPYNFEYLLTLLKECGHLWGIFTKRKLFSFKNKRVLLEIDDKKVYAPLNANANLMVAERRTTYSIEDELTKRPEKYSQA
jgi:hypothetical protein